MYGLPDASARAFFGAYADEAGLGPGEIARFERAGVLLDLAWVATVAGAVAQEPLAARRRCEL